MYDKRLLRYAQGKVTCMFFVCFTYLKHTLENAWKMSYPKCKTHISNIRNHAHHAYKDKYL